MMDNSIHLFLCWLGTTYIKAFIYSYRITTNNINAIVLSNHY